MTDQSRREQLERRFAQSKRLLQQVATTRSRMNELTEESEREKELEKK